MKRIILHLLQTIHGIGLFLIPTGFVLVNSIFIDPTFLSTGVMGVIRFVFLFVALPVYLIYGWMTFIRFFPDTWIGAFGYMLPVVIGFATMGALSPQGLNMDSIILQSFIYFSGQFTSLLIGLIILAIPKMDGTSDKAQRIIALSIFLLLGAIALTPVIGSAIQLNTATGQFGSDTIGTLLVILNMGIVCAAYLRQLTVMYKEGRL